MISFTVFGTPQPQGSSRAFIPKGWNRPIITSANPKNKPWRQEIAGTALAEMERVKLKAAAKGVPVTVEATFYFTKPKSARKRDLHKVTKPDADKLARSLLDALTGIAFADDSQVIQIKATKLFGAPERVAVTVYFVEAWDVIS